MIYQPLDPFGRMSCLGFPDLSIWPRSLLAFPLAAVVFGLQAVPVLGMLLAMVRAEYLPGAILYAGAAGVTYEVLSGRVPRVWLVVPLAVLLLAVLPRWLERGPSAQERNRVAKEDQATPGPGAQNLGILVDWPDVARILVLRYDITVAYARRDVTSVDFVAYRLSHDAKAGTPTTSSLLEEPSGALTVETTYSHFERERIEGYELRTVARWPDGGQRARVGVDITLPGLLAFPIAGCPLGDWLKPEPCRIRLARPRTRSYGYVRPHDPAAEAADIAMLIGLDPRSRHSAGLP